MSQVDLIKRQKCKKKKKKVLLDDVQLSSALTWNAQNDLHKTATLGTACLHWSKGKHILLSAFPHTEAAKS